MINLKRILDEALTIPADKAGPIELKLRDALTSNYKDFKYADTIVKCCRNDEKSKDISEKNLKQMYIVGLGNIIDLLKSYDKCKAEYAKQKINKKVSIQRSDGKTIELDPIKDFNKIGKLSVLKQLVDKFEKLVQNDYTIPIEFKKYAITSEDRQFIRLICWNSRVMVWGTKRFEPSQKFAVQLWQNIQTIDSGSAYGEPDKQCPYCTHAINHWDQYSNGDENYEQYWYLAIPKGVECTKAGDLNNSEVVKVYNAMKGLGPKILVCQHDSTNDWCDREDTPLGGYEDGYEVDIHDAKNADDEFVFGPPGHNYYDNVVELYDKYFQKSQFSFKKFDWESQKDYEERGGSQKIVPKSDEEGIQLDGQINDFDLENDVWEHSINIDEKAFDKNGILKIQLPRKIKKSIQIRNAIVQSLDGFPTQFIGSSPILTFTNCKIKNVGDWKIEHSDGGLSLVVTGATIDQNSGLAEAISGIDFRFISIYDVGAIRKIRSVQQLDIISPNLLVDFGILKNVKIEDKLDLSRDAYSNNVGPIVVKSFAGLNLSSVKSLALEPIKINDIDSFAKLDFSSLKSLRLKIANQDISERRQIFRTVVEKTSSSCNVYYNEVKPIRVNLERPSLQNILDDKSESWFDGLPFKSDNFLIGRMDFSDSPKREFEYFAWKNGQGSNKTFKTSEIPLFKILNENPDELFKILVKNRNSDFRVVYFGIVQNGSIVSINNRNGSVVECTFRHDDETICFKCNNQKILDKALKAFLKDRKTSFKQITGLMIPAEFKGTTISGINDPELSLYFQVIYDKTDYSKQTSAFNNLKTIQNCNVKAIVENLRKHNDLVIKDCIISEKIRINALRFENCIINGNGESLFLEFKLNASDGIYNCNFVLPQSGSLPIDISAKTIQNCSFQGIDYLVIKKCKTISNSSFDVHRLSLQDDDGIKIVNSSFNIVPKEDTCELEVMTSGNNDVTNLAAAIVKGLTQKSKIWIFRMNGKITNLNFLNELKCQIDCLELDDLKYCESFEFKLKKPNLIKALIAGCIEFNDTCQTFSGFDASTPLALKLTSTGAAEKKNPLVAQYFKYFTEKHDSELKTATVPDRYAKDGQFRPNETSLDESFWLGILKMIN